MATTISGLLETYIDNKVADDKKGEWPRNVKDLTWWELFKVVGNAPSGHPWNAEDVAFVVQKEIRPWTLTPWICVDRTSSTEFVVYSRQSNTGAEAREATEGTWYYSDVHLASYVLWALLPSGASKNHSGDDFRDDRYRAFHIQLFEWGTKIRIPNLTWTVSGEEKGAKKNVNLFWLSGIWQGGDWAERWDYEPVLNPDNTMHFVANDGAPWESYGRRGLAQLKLVHAVGIIDEDINKLLNAHTNPRGNQKRFDYEVHQLMDEMIKNHDFAVTYNWHGETATAEADDGTPQPYFQPRYKFWSTGEQILGTGGRIDSEVLADGITSMTLIVPDGIRNWNDGDIPVGNEGYKGLGPDGTDIAARDKFFQETRDANPGMTDEEIDQVYWQNIFYGGMNYGHGMVDLYLGQWNCHIHYNRTMLSVDLIPSTGYGTATAGSGVTSTAAASTEKLTKDTGMRLREVASSEDTHTDAFEKYLLFPWSSLPDEAVADGFVKDGHSYTYNYAFAAFYQVDQKPKRKVPNQPRGLDGRDLQQVQNFYDNTRGSDTNTTKVELAAVKNIGWKGTLRWGGYTKNSVFRIKNNSWNNLINELENEWKPRSGDNEEIKARYGYYIDVHALYDMYVHMCAEALALQFLTFSLSIETVKFFKELEQVVQDFGDAKLFESKLKDGNRKKADVDAALRKAEGADTVAFDNNAGKAADDSELKTLTFEDVEERQKFLKQCALLMNLQRFKIVYQKEFKRKQNKNNYMTLGETVVHTVESQTYNLGVVNIINSIVASKGSQLSPFLYSNPALQAALIPKLRFYKIYNDKYGKLKEVEFRFQKNYNPNDSIYNIEKASGYADMGLKEDEDGDVFWDRSMLMDRGGGGGIKNFNWKFEGTTPATAKNDIEAELTLFFDSFQELLKVRSNDSLFSPDGKLEKYQYIELLLLGFQDEERESTIATYDPKNYRVKVDVGWELRKDASWHELIGDSFNSRFGITPGHWDKALSLMNKSYYLNMVDHDLDFKPDGSVTVKVTYRAYLETAMKSTNLDALSTPSLLKEKISLKKEYESVLKNKLCEKEEQKATLEKLIDTYNAIELDQQKRAHQSIIQRLVTRNKMHYCLIDKADVNNFVNRGFFAGSPRIIFPAKMKVNKAAKVTTSSHLVAQDDDSIKREDIFLDATLNRIDYITTAPDSNQELITFFYVGDLVHVVLDCMISPETDQFFPSLRNTKIVLSDFKYVDNMLKTHQINISEIPIATEYFFEWMNQNAIKVKKRAYPVGLFIRDLCNKLIVELMMEKCLNRSNKRQLHFNTMPIAAMGAISQVEGIDVYSDPFLSMEKVSGEGHISLGLAYNQDKLPLKTNVPYGQIHGLYNYYLIHAIVDDDVAEMQNGELSLDGQKGIYHLHVGKDRGIVKKIKFTKTDIAFLREARYFTQGADGLAQLANVYKATIEMVGNTIFYPGMYVYIDTRFLGGDAFNPSVRGSPAEILGLGGYHLVTRVSNDIAPGKFSTTVEALYVNNGANEVNDDNVLIQTKPKNILKIDEIKDSCGQIAHLRMQNFEMGINDPEMNFAELSAEQLDKKFKEKK